MTDNSKSNELLQKNKVENYHHNQDRALIARLREKMATEERTEALINEGGIRDPELAAQLSELGVEPNILPCLHLMPLIQVAWADGEIQPEEHALLLKAAATRGITNGTAFDFFNQMLQARPSTELTNGAMSLIRHVLEAMGQDQAAIARNSLFELSKNVADASGGIFGLWGRIEESESETLATIAAQLANSHEAAAQSLLSEL